MLGNAFKFISYYAIGTHLVSQLSWDGVKRCVKSWDGVNRGDSEFN